MLGLTAAATAAGVCVSPSSSPSDDGLFTLTSNSDLRSESREEGERENETKTRKPIIKRKQVLHCRNPQYHSSYPLCETLNKGDRPFKKGVPSSIGTQFIARQCVLFC